jgi:glycosyltransferase involved in cell wall biosynthesis
MSIDPISAFENLSFPIGDRIVNYAKDIRAAWLFPSLNKGNYWHPIFRDFSQRFETIVYAGLWPGFSPGLEDTFAVEVVGKTQFGQDYSARITNASPKIIFPLLKFRPQIIFASGFSIWTILALLLKPVAGWRVAILYDGSSPSIDFRNSWARLLLRRFLVRIADGFCANSGAAKDYLIDVLHAPPAQVFGNTYLVPDVTALVPTHQVAAPVTKDAQIVTFLFVGELIPRKGMRQLLQTCALLNRSSPHQYRLLVVGDGQERAELAQIATAENLDDFVTWLGWLPYERLGAYFQLADALIFPTLEDVWGMVVLEAMAFGQPVLCSRWAGAAELIVPGENGELFDPHHPAELAALMARVLQQPQLLETMGANARRMTAQYTPTAAVDNFQAVVDRLLGANKAPD